MFSKIISKEMGESYREVFTEKYAYSLQKAIMIFLMVVLTLAISEINNDPRSTTLTKLVGLGIWWLFVSLAVVIYSVTDKMQERRIIRSLKKGAREK